jgi:hypothetical protein
MFGSPVVNQTAKNTRGARPERAEARLPRLDVLRRLVGERARTPRALPCQFIFGAFGHVGRGGGRR